VTYSCDAGHLFAASVQGVVTEQGGTGQAVLSSESTFQVSCRPDGTFSDPPAGVNPDASGNYVCAKVSCGVPPTVGHATVTPSTAAFAFDTVTYTCDDKYTVDGTSQGIKSWNVACQVDGTFASSVTNACSMVGFEVMGQVKDSTNVSPIPGATVKLLNSSVPAVTTDSDGKYTLFMPLGIATIKASKDDGYIAKEKEISVADTIGIGGVADVSLSPKLCPNCWQVVLEWGEKPRDLDSWSYFGPQQSCDLGWKTPGKRVTCSSGWKADLDVDDTRSYGPETTTFKDVDAATCGSSCKIYFYVHNYSGDGDIKTVSEAVVTLTHGSEQVRQFKATAADGSATGDGYITGSGRSEWWKVFSVDVKTNTVKACRNVECS